MRRVSLREATFSLTDPDDGPASGHVHLTLTLDDVQYVSAIFEYQVFRF